jgi:hypothetical protein
MSAASGSAPLLCLSLEEMSRTSCAMLRTSEENCAERLSAGCDLRLRAASKAESDEQTGQGISVVSLPLKPRGAPRLVLADV